MKRQYYLASDGLKLPVHVVGRGRPLIMLHGWTGSYFDFRPLLPALSERFTCYLAEARPHQEGPEPTVERMGRDVHDLIGGLGLEQPVLLGHSMGASVGWEYLRQFGSAALAAFGVIDMSPKLMTDDGWSLGLYGANRPQDNQRFVDYLQRDFAEAVVDLIAKSRDGIPLELLEARRQRLQRMAGAPWIEAWQSLVGQDYRELLPRIEVPVFLAYGARSRYYGPEVARYVQARTPRAELVLYPQAGHSPHLEAIEDFTADFLDFAARHVAA